MFKVDTLQREDASTGFGKMGWSDRWGNDEVNEGRGSNMCKTSEVWNVKCYGSSNNVPKCSALSLVFGKNLLLNVGFGLWTKKLWNTHTNIISVIPELVMD